MMEKFEIKDFGEDYPLDYTTHDDGE